jgi:hypothetical protein
MDVWMERTKFEDGYVFYSSSTVDLLPKEESKNSSLGGLWLCCKADPVN